MVNYSRSEMDQADEVTAMSAEEAWKQLRLAGYRIPAPETMERYVDAGKGMMTS